MYLKCVLNLLMLCTLLSGEFYQQNTTNCMEMLMGRKKGEKECLTQNNANPQQVIKVNPNPKCKHQIILLHTFYRINTLL